MAVYHVRGTHGAGCPNRNLKVYDLAHGEVRGVVSANTETGEMLQARVRRFDPNILIRRPFKVSCEACGFEDRSLVATFAGPQFSPDAERLAKLEAFVVAFDAWSSAGGIDGVPDAGEPDTSSAELIDLADAMFSAREALR